MLRTGVLAFDHAIEITNVWLKELMAEEGWTNRQKAYLAFRNVLHALRDRLGMHEAAHLGTQLPLLIRGVYFEGWTPADKPLNLRGREEFLSYVEEGLRGEIDFNAEQACRGVFWLLNKHVSAHELVAVKASLPEPIRELWPD